MTCKRFLMLALVFAWFGRDGARAQQAQPVASQQPDCFRLFDFTAQSSGAQAAGSVSAGSTGTTSVIDNTQAGCLDWLVAYSTTSTVGAVSLAFQTANNIAGVPGTWGNYPGTLTTGINPNTAVGNGAVTDATGDKYPFLRMNLTSLTGTGRVQGILYGWKRRPTYVTVTGGGGCAGTIGTPCVVVGTKSNNAVVPGATNLGVLPAIANAAAPTWTEGFQVLNSVDLSGNTRTVAVGTKTNNAAAPGTNNLGALGFIANAAAPTYTEGNQVLGSVDLAGAQRITGTVVITPSGTQNVNLAQVAGTNTVTGGVAGLLAVAGSAASGATQTGNPVKVGGVFNTTQPTVTNGQAVDAQFSARGSLLVIPGVEGFPVTIAANSSVNLAQVAGTNTVTGGVAGLLAVAGSAASGATQTGNPVKVGGVFNTTQPTVTNGQAVDAQFSARGSHLVANGVEAFTVQPGNTVNTTPWLVAPSTEATTTNSALTSYTAAAAATNSTSVKASAGNVYQITSLNTTSTVYYLRMYNSSGAPTCSSATGFVETLAIPNAAGAGAGYSVSNVVPQGYTTGIGFCITGGPTSTDNTNAAAGVFVRILYK